MKKANPSNRDVLNKILATVYDIIPGVILAQKTTQAAVVSCIFMYRI